MAKQNPEDLTDTRPLLVKKQEDAADLAKWKLALSYVKSNDLDQARKVLIELTERPNSFKNKASKTLEKINK